MAGTNQQPDLANPGLRERNKAEKRQRIRLAARELFSEHGYEQATMRQIARRAGVALGTLFHYAQDKRDLIFLIFNEELALVTAQALQAPQPDQTFLDQLLAVFATHYYFFGREPVLSRILLRELLFYSEGVQAGEFLGIRGQLMTGITEVVRAAQAGGSIVRDQDPGLIARSIFFVFSGHIRWWIASPVPRPYTGLADLRQMLDLQISGLQT